MKRLKILLSVLLLLLFILSVGFPSAVKALFDLPNLPNLPGLPDLPGIDPPEALPTIPNAVPTPTPKPTLHLEFNPLFPLVTPKPTLNIPAGQELPNYPLISPTPTMQFDPDLPIPKLPELPFPLPSPGLTDTPQDGDGGQTMTSEGPPFLSFRSDLTGEPWMFTPMDLSLNGEYRFPLVGDASRVIGEAKVVVQSGVAVITYLVVNGVKVDDENGFFTFFPDIRAISSVRPADLQSVKLKFGMPYPIAAWLSNDQKVLLYINCSVSYDANLAGLSPFSFQDPAYLARLAELFPLMD